jgi:hypothetical protein
MDVITLLGNMGPIHQPISLEGVKIEMGSLTLVQYFIKFLIYIQLMCRLMNIYIFINLLKDLLLVPLLKHVIICIKFIFINNKPC